MSIKNLQLFFFSIENYDEINMTSYLIHEMNRKGVLEMYESKINRKMFKALSLLSR